MTHLDFLSLKVIPTKSLNPNKPVSSMSYDFLDNFEFQDVMGP